MPKTTLVVALLIIASLFLSGCILQKESELTIPGAQPSVGPTREASPGPTLKPERQQDASQDSGLSPVQGDEINEGEEVVE